MMGKLNEANVGVKIKRRISGKWSVCVRFATIILFRETLIFVANVTIEEMEMSAIDRYKDKCSAQEALDRLAGRDISVCARTRSTANYAMWDRIADFLDTNPSKAQILFQFNKELNQKSAYITISPMSHRAMELVIQERKWK